MPRRDRRLSPKTEDFYFSTFGEYSSGSDSTTLGTLLGIDGATVDELYDAMDWLRARQASIERKLARRHLAEGGLVMFDVSSSYFEGSA